MADLTLGLRKSSGPEALEALLKSRPLHLQDAWELFTDGGAKEALPEGTLVTPFHRWNGYSGYRYQDKKRQVSGEVGFAPQSYGGFVFHKIFENAALGERREWWEIYFDEGILIKVEEHQAPSLLYVDQIEMDLDCPIRSHLFNYLSHEYQRASQGGAYAKQIALVERYLRTKKIELHRDPALRQFWTRIDQAEATPVLSWAERQTVIESILAERGQLLRAKARALRSSRLRAWATLLLGDWNNRFHRIRKRPGSILAGFSYKYTIGVIVWFVTTVRSNIGYSMALALYGPFTFYFITQPLNPHAMWAVGKVRSSYIEGIEKLKSTFSLNSGESGGAQAPALPAATHPVAAPQGNATPKPGVPAGSTTQGGGTAALPATTSLLVQPLKSIPGAGTLGLPLSFEYPEVDSQSWSDRMSSFKDMQIAYESNMQFAARMGRLEQMETQLNFAMIMDVAWREVERTLDQIQELKKLLARETSASTHGPLASQFTAVAHYLDQEREVAEKIQLYLWDRQTRYILDHPYTVMDQSKEQVYRDSYIGHSFLLLREMTQTLANRHGRQLRKPAEYTKIEKLAASFEKERKPGDSVLGRLQANSAIFGRANPYSGEELRASMKRQWEILFLLQNKAQEAANFGLQTYTWSVRNAVFTLQGIYSAKRRELELFTLSRLAATSKGGEAALEEVKKSIDPIYEQLFHLMTLEYASINPELGGRLSQDIESKQRRSIIDLMQGSLRGREAFLKAWSALVRGGHS